MHDQNVWAFTAEAVVALLAAGVFLLPSGHLRPATGLRKWALVGASIPIAAGDLIAGFGLVLVPVAILFDDAGVPLPQLLESLLPLMLTPVWFGAALAAFIFTMLNFSLARVAASLVILTTLGCFLAGDEMARGAFQFAWTIARDVLSNP